MKRHSPGVISLLFGLLFVAIAGWWAASYYLNWALDYHVPNLGWFAAGVLILLGLLGVVASLRRDRPEPRPVASPTPAPDLGPVNLGPVNVDPVNLGPVDLGPSHPGRPQGRLDVTQADDEPVAVPPADTHPPRDADPLRDADPARHDGDAVDPAPDVLEHDRRNEHDV